MNEPACVYCGRSSRINYDWLETVPFTAIRKPGRRVKLVESGVTWPRLAASIFFEQAANQPQFSINRLILIIRTNRECMGFRRRRAAARRDTGPRRIAALKRRGCADSCVTRAFLMYRPQTRSKLCATTPPPWATPPRESASTRRTASLRNPSWVAGHCRRVYNAWRPLTFHWY